MPRAPAQMHPRAPDHADPLASGVSAREASGSAAGVPIEILLVEDNPGDVRLTEEGLREGRVRNNLSVVHDGEQALAFLDHQPPYADAVRPDLILLDLNLPKVDGHEVLMEIKADPALRGIPVVILTTSDTEEDVRRAYANHASSFVTKPVDFEKFVGMIRELGLYWLTVVKLPGGPFSPPPGLEPT